LPVKEDAGLADAEFAVHADHMARRTLIGGQAAADCVATAHP